MARHKKIIISTRAPVLYGSTSIFRNKCGKKTCACHQNTKKLHGPYYRWTGLVDGKLTSRLISNKIAKECQRRISNFRKLLLKLEKIKQQSFKNAPWNDSS